VEKILYDMDLMKAKVVLRIDGRYDRIPNDSDAAIFTSGLLGGQYVGITPGGSDQFYANGDQIEFVQDAVILEHLISKYLFSQAGRQSEPADKPAAE
jgi:phospholipid/cholesterol/gamma-HCH transport system substrate-binding protein